MPRNFAQRAKLDRFEILAARLYMQDKMSTAEIAERLGCARQTVLDALKRCEIPIERRGAMFT